MEQEKVDRTKVEQRQQEGKLKGHADIVFLIDATESMDPIIEELKKSLQTFVDNLAIEEVEVGGERNPLDWRARVIPFRDVYEDGSDAVDLSNDFVTDEGELKRQIEKIEVSGGGKITEGVLDALYLAIKDTDWRPKDKVTRVLILFTDAPTWEEMHENTVEENEDRSVNTVINLISGDRIHLFLIAPEDNAGIYDKLEKTPKANYYRRGKEGDQVKIHQELVNNTDYNEMMETIAKTVSRSSPTEKA